jgi:hypothetical protein
MAIRYPTNFPQRINQRVPAMSYDAQVQMGGHVYVEFGTPAAASTTSILLAQDMTRLVRRARSLRRICLVLRA